jgi:hypothetical protein
VGKTSRVIQHTSELLAVAVVTIHNHLFAVHRRLLFVGCLVHLGLSYHIIGLCKGKNQNNFADYKSRK